MMRRATIAGLLAALLGAGSAGAESEVLTAEEVRLLLSGNTLTGRYSNGQPYSEHHHPDGRVFGHNNRKPVENGCWDLRGDLACYYYREDSARGPFCWSFRRLGGDAYRATYIGRDGWEIVALLQKGNPHGHSDNGKPWTCEPLQSWRRSPGDDRARHASR
jgi:hypothetical protein